MKIPFLDMTRQHVTLQPEIEAAMARVCRRAWFILGEELEAFEQEFAAYLGARFGVGVGSGTEALHLALLACGVQPGDEVITVPNTAVPTISAISFAQATPVLVDIDPDTFTMNVAQVEAAITARTRVLLPVHLYGQTADLAPLLEIARRHNLRVVEDACQAHGATYGRRKAGTCGDAGCFSFYPSKNLGAYGDAGLVCTDQPEIAERLRLLRNYGQTRRYYHATKGFNSRLDELQAAILRTKLPHLDRWNARRQELAQRYDELLRDLPLTLPRRAAHGQHVFHLYVVRTPQRDQLCAFLTERGVQTIIHYPVPVHLQEAYRDLNLAAGCLPEAEHAAREIVSLPLYPEMRAEEIEFVAACIREFFQKH
ncbi:MAG: DegT/DnrJ/EryC1/StrS family aminotransferase [candidate division KSB1 bacterium]|nr:DegT/DnrJ/EryC1/StrS family aminotransferase [candidate division KSB1 bacterium]MDZ7275978.1 DegT/DnrJ/EryC1/StrS family aminotransferase [candidate division KSB1 bacterium]MDZ7285740.1 DegT/DnrJ/EryC1/StrS family aminotransferase [candidate division KSB1 bacterium]MDZ7298772.1 DegT/DnrJ/EryC1/StrS family aminotransferase [candidate division KSB1 bacterium]MDZ7305955.1 DegT/DnrJ/EryC1/StrS family aminotransferase [candidate division KSB1 bacterium]